MSWSSRRSRRGDRGRPPKAARFCVQLGLVRRPDSEMLPRPMRYLAVSLLIVVCACHKRADKAFFGTQVAPPGILAQVHPGMTVAQLRAIAPELKADPAKGLLLASPASNVKLYALADGDVVSSTYVDFEDANGPDVLTA